MLIVQRPAGSGRRLVGVERLVEALHSAGATVDILDGHGGVQLEALALREGWCTTTATTITAAGPAAASSLVAGAAGAPAVDVATASAAVDVATATAAVDVATVRTLLHYEQQFSLFSRARFVVAAHGAALANLAFGDSRSCRSVELMPEQVREQTRACMNWLWAVGSERVSE